MDEKTNLGPLFSERGLTGVLRQIDIAVSKGARLVVGGQRVSRRGYYLEPTILTDITRNNPVFGEEIFGPVACVYAVDSEDEAVEIAKPLKKSRPRRVGSWRRRRPLQENRRTYRERDGHDQFGKRYQSLKHRSEESRDPGSAESVEARH